jgi:HK97 gp10 family phage protein
MAVRAKLVTKGFEAYLEELVRQAHDIHAVTDEALEAGGDVLLDGRKKRVPKDTRQLEDNLSVMGPYKDGNFHFITVGIDKDAPGEVHRYGLAQEFGTSNMPGQPYIRPTIDEDMTKARAAMRKVFKSKGKI